MAGYLRGRLTYGCFFWDGNPSSFQAFEVACKWFEKTLKEAERRGAAARVWARLSGPAKSVVKHLEVLKSSPLQTLPIPDSFAKLEKWHQLRRKDGESIPELHVREDELFLELQQSLRRSRAKGPGGTTTLTGTAPRAGEEREAEPAEAVASRPLDFFEDELRGFRLLKASGISYPERQQVLTLTGNSVAFEKARQALRALFDDAPEAEQDCQLCCQTSVCQS